MTAPSERHAFVDSGTYRLGPSGSRRYAVCGACGGLRVGLLHSVTGSPPPPRSVRPASSPAIVAGVEHHGHTAAAHRPAPLSWRLHLLRHSVDVALAHPDDLDPALELRLRELERALRSTFYGSHEVEPVAPALELVREPERSREPSPLANASVRKAAHAFRSGKLRELFLRAVRDGQRWERTGGGHVVIHGPSGSVSLSQSVPEGVGRGWLNTRAAARRAGLDVTGL